MLDFHTLHTISNGVNYYKNNIEAFKTLFNDVSEDYATKLFNKLNETNVSFNQSYIQNHEKLPLITTKLTENSSDNVQVLNNRSFNNNKVMLLNQNVQICIYETELDVLRVLHRIVQASMLNFKKNFLQIGYINIEFNSSKETIVNEDLVSEGVITFERILTYNAQKQLIVQPIDEIITEVFWATVPTVKDNIN